VAALEARVAKRIYGYTGLESPAYLDALRAWFARRQGWAIEEADIFFSPGVVPALAFLIDTLTEPGDGIIIQRPVYHPFTNMIRSHGRTLVNNALREGEGGWVMDFEDLEAKARDPRNKLLILSSPHNPVGRVWTREELGRLGRICLDNSVLVLSDEIHGDLVRRGLVQTPLASLFPDERKAIITATAPSKTFNLAGLQVSSVIIHDRELGARWKAHVEGRLGLSNPNCFALVAATAAYAEGEAWLEELLAYLDANLAFLAGFLAERLPWVKYRRPEGSYLAWLDLRGLGLPEKEILARLCREGRVLLQGGSTFGPEGEGFLRMNVACPRAILREGLERMAEVLLRAI
jgi:cystathionine beta-lyase